MRHCNNMNAKNICHEIYSVSGIWCHAYMIKATEANPEARNLNIVLRGLSGWFLFPCWSPHPKTNCRVISWTHPSWMWAKKQQHCIEIWAARWKGSQEAPTQSKSMRALLGSSWGSLATPAGNVRVVNQRTQPPSSGNSAAGLYLQLMPFLHPKYPC